MPPTTKTKADPLTADERKLLEELQARAAAASDDRPDSIDRELTTRERVLGEYMRDRDHLDGCPAIDDKRRAAARTEAYGATRPPIPAQGLGPRPVVIVRCVECGGSRYADGITRPDELILAELARRAGASTDDTDLDTAL